MATGGFDYILLQSGAIKSDGLFGLRSTKNRSGGAKIIQWTGDARAEAMENVTQYKGIADLTLLAVGVGQREMYETALGCPVDYLQQGVFNSFFIEPKELTEGKAVFIGNNYDHFDGAVERSALCERLSLHFSFDHLIYFEVIGNGFVKEQYVASIDQHVNLYSNYRSIPYVDSAKIYNESYISISHACFNDIEGYYSNRTIDIMASGGCCLQRWFPGIENYFTDGYDCVVYRTNEEALEKIQYLIERPEVRNMIARNGHNTAKQKHTFAVRAKEIKQLIDKHL